MTFLIYLLAFVALCLVAANLRTRFIGRNVTQLVPQAGELARVDGGTLHYIDIGPRDSQTLVLIHGLSGQLQHFTYALSDRLARDFRVIAVDRPGCGYSTRDSDALADLEEQGRMIGALLDRLQVSDPVLVGHSLGGAISLGMALNRADKTAALALICPLTHPEDTPSEAFQGLGVTSPFLRRLIGHTVAVPLGNRAAAKVLEIVFRPDTCPDDFLTRGGGALGLRPKAYITAAGDYCAADPSIRRLAERYAGALSVPGGVLFGQDDTVLSPAKHGAPMTAYGLSHDTLPGRGHMIPLTAPEDCDAFIRRIAALGREKSA